MIEFIEICLDGPICQCEEENLEWSLRQDDNEEVGLLVYCETCGCEEFVPEDVLKAGFSLEVGYPGGIKEESCNILSLVPGLEESND